MKYEFDRLNRKLLDGELLDDLRAVAAKLGRHTVTRAEQDRLGQFSSSSICRRFGGWAEAHEHANLRLEGNQRNWRRSDENLFENLESVWRKLGRQPRLHEMVPPLSEIEGTTYKRRYGTWLGALEKFVASANAGDTEFSAQAVDLPSGRTRRTGRTVNWRLRFFVLQRDRFMCVACGRSPATTPGTVLHVDHIVAWSNGGETVPENLQTLCEPCNQGKSNT